MAYAYRLPVSSFLRQHSEKHNRQLGESLPKFLLPGEGQSYLRWFYTLPFFLELPGLRAVHACWDRAHIEWLKAGGHLVAYRWSGESLLTDQHFVSVSSLNIEEC